ncbi:MAG: hypothetical protein WCQ41_09920 [Bacillota bacterium]
MIGYLLKLRERLVALKAGVSGHTTKWTGQAETPATIQDSIDALDDMDGEIADLESKIAVKRKDSRILEAATNVIVGTIESKAYAFHKTEPAELVSYGLKPPKPSEKKPIPSADLVPNIKDDHDGIGFIISTNIDPDADGYDWERGVATDPADMNTLPTMAFYKHTTKTTFVDEYITKGKRYFYRVRANNASGDGPWSPPQSKIQ